MSEFKWPSGIGVVCGLLALVIFLVLAIGGKLFGWLAVGLALLAIGIIFR